MPFKKPNQNKTTLTTKYIPFVLILALTLFLRFFQLGTLAPFISDQGKDFIAAEKAVKTGTLPLLGIESSVPRFRQGPLYIWITALVLKIGNLDPYYPSLVAAALGSLAVGATYLLAQRFFSTNTAIISSIMLATSPLAVAHSRLAFHINAIPLFSAIYLYLLFTSLEKKQLLPLTVFSFALLFQFELVVFPLVLMLPVAYMFTGKPIKIKNLLRFVLALILGLIPQIIYDLTHHFQQLSLFLVWIGYRIIGFFAPEHQHTISLEKISSTFLSIITYSQKFFSWPFPPLATIFLIIILLSLTQAIRSGHRRQQLLALWLLIMLASFFVLGNASEAYFPVLFVPVSILLASHLDSYKFVFIRNLSLSFILVTGFVNSFFLVKSGFILSRSQVLDTGNQFNTYGPPIIDQIATIQNISSYNQPFWLVSSDPNSHIESYLDNYRYLLIWFGLSESSGGVPIWINSHESSPLPPNVKQFHHGSIILGVPLY